MTSKDKVILITGAAERVGRQVALTLAAQKGAQIAFTYFLENEPWQETEASLKGAGVKAKAYHLDISDPDEIRRVVAAVLNDFGRIDALINNAGVWLKAPFLEISEKAWDTAMDVNLKGPFLLSQAVAPIMQAQEAGGVILNITDLSAYQVWQGYTHHAVSKVGLAWLTRYMALELAPKIRVNAIAPGTVMLPENAPPEKVAWAVDKSALKRVGSAEDVARMVVFLLENDFTTGSVYFVDGGRSLV
ncbi:MAG: SDR family oxidoreductase [Anaerolineae bacterium]|jgi:NAD(P)-dependent dehydrogenase (short-subunit alcohol dehydrogenase family)|nr:SDR family oxidoreductase [Anaerolineae bacterium]